MKYVLSLLIFLFFTTFSHAGMFDFLKSDESFCIDTLVKHEIRDVAAAQICTNPVPTQSCMKRVFKDIKERKPKDSYERPIWVAAAKACTGNK